MPHRVSIDAAEAHILPTKHRKDINLPQQMIDEARQPQRIPFSAEKHLRFQEPEKIHTTQELGLGKVGISDHAVTEPFSIFTPEAIQQIRAEIFSDEVLNQHYCPTSPTSGQIRGHCPTAAPFTYAAWTSPEVVAWVSKMAGVELVPAIDYDIGHVNIALPKPDGVEEKIVAPGEQKEGEVSEYCESAFGWHTDSYAFVCVAMLSDCTGMVGGETFIRTGTGEVMKARGPQLGTAVVMQGAYLPHQATAARGNHERISMVTSWRPKCPLMKDHTMMRGTKNISHLPMLYHQYAEYRMENLEERVRREARSLRKRRALEPEKFDVVRMRTWLEEQRDYIDDMLRELQVDRRVLGSYGFET
ncbi:hypothetical protein CB0940_11025 [Cercospora beticola]|uniref:Fe2OG dioxygenase domain-containing protein n=1 Tax=Cercospora beticola TaxID=122368 RepID=A0A2G5HD89_CERBT|nr:hypothetical protein CB0940_11025 [Cercospora beticola]PIA90501.1 hypothetical protein CB0940_11025 [Cercospora beticola]